LLFNVSAQLARKILRYIHSIYTLNISAELEFGSVFVYQDTGEAVNRRFCAVSWV
jgi:hypothetical protein